MRKDTKKAFKVMLDALRQDLNNTETPEINKLLPEYGELWTDDYDEGHCVITRFKRTEDEAVEMAQDELLNGKYDDMFQDFIVESRLLPLMLDFMREVAREVCKC